MGKSLKARTYIATGDEPPRITADFYPTPGCALDVLFQQVSFTGEIWECACGNGAISKYLEERKIKTYSSDIRSRKEKVYGDPGIDFLASKRRAKNILTNPPYKFAEMFVRKSLELVERKAVFLLPLSFFEGVTRYKLMIEHPPAHLILISRKLPYLDGRTLEWKKTGVWSHVWAVWNKAYKGPTVLTFGVWDPADPKIPELSARFFTRGV